MVVATSDRLLDGHQTSYETYLIIPSTVQSTIPDTIFNLYKAPSKELPVFVNFLMNAFPFIRSCRLSATIVIVLLLPILVVQSFDGRLHLVRPRVVVHRQHSLLVSSALLTTTSSTDKRWAPRNFPTHSTITRKLPLTAERQSTILQLQYGSEESEEKSSQESINNADDTDLNKFRSLMGNLYGIAGLAHAADSFLGPSALISASGSPPFADLPIEGKGLVALWCLAGPLAFALAQVGNRVADIGLILYGLIEVFGAYFLPDDSAVINAIVVQVVVFAAWQYSKLAGDKKTEGNEA